MYVRETVFVRVMCVFYDKYLVVLVVVWWAHCECLFVCVYVRMCVSV